MSLRASFRLRCDNCGRSLHENIATYLEVSCLLNNVQLWLHFCDALCNQGWVEEHNTMVTAFVSVRLEACI